MRNERRRGGFTLLEILLALTIMGFITTILWSSFAQTQTTKRALEAAQDRSHGVRVALLRMAREIEMAFLSDSENTAVEERRTLFVAESHTDSDELRFSAFAHQRLRADSAESDTSVIRYYVERDPEVPGQQNLMRRDTRRLQAADAKAEPGEAYVLCPDVRRFKLHFYDFKKKEWRDDWDTYGADGLPYIPTHVRIELTVVDERGREITYTTDARPQMTERVAYRPVRS